jgi:hypothetical protein
MNFKQLSNYQLYEIIQNQKLDKDIRTLATDEFDLRKLTMEQIREIIKKRESLFQPEKGEHLNFKYKIVALIIPFFWVIHVLMTSRYLARGQKRKWNEYWLFFCIGLLLWTIAIIIIAKYSFV